jgi:cell wall-associated NlpC family hydrolase
MVADLRRVAGWAAAAALAAAALLPAAPARADTPPDPAALAGRALNWAEAHAHGRPYVYGGAGPGGYDCSGLVMAAYAAAGVTLPHNTGAMLASGKLTQVPIATAPRGALLFFGPGHVEMDTIWPHTSYGAHHSGTTVGWRAWSPGYYEPTAAYVVTG